MTISKTEHTNRSQVSQLDYWLTAASVILFLGGREYAVSFLPNFREATACDGRATTLDVFCTYGPANRRSRNSVLEIQYEITWHFKTKTFDFFFSSVLSSVPTSEALLSRRSSQHPYR